MNTVNKFIIVDDDPFNNAICTMEIQFTIHGAQVKSFAVPEEGLSFIENGHFNTAEPVILFLDINMPGLTGWEFLEHFANLNDEIKNQVAIYMLSSSVDHRDKMKAGKNKYIKGFFSKPLTSETILSIAKT